ncbi:MAG: hypothetical protein IJ747_07730 [Lachnospiraceae bacterium]|nr:hypothetical protein [Lachnospiraceae bacterium]
MKEYGKYQVQTKISKKAVSYTVFFAVYMFAFSMMLTLIGSNMGYAVDNGVLEKLYYGDMILMMTGFALFGVIAGKLGKHIRKLIPPVCFLDAAGIILLPFLRQRGYIGIVELIMACALGITGGYVYFRMATGLAGEKALGRIVGMGGALSVLFQFILSEAGVGSSILCVLTGICFAVLAVGVVVTNSERAALNGEPAAAVNGEQRKAMNGELAAAKAEMRVCEAGGVSHGQLIRLCLIVAFLVVLGNFYDNWFARTLAEQTAVMELYAWPRLVLAADYLIFGWITDRWGRNALSLSVLCTALVAFLNLMLSGTASVWWVSIVLYYLLVGAIISYYNLQFLMVAPGLKHTALWAGAGRIINGITSVICGLLVISSFPTVAVMVIDLVMFAGICICMAWNGYLVPGRGKAGEQGIAGQSAGMQGGAAQNAGAQGWGEGAGSLSDAERLERFTAVYGLTEREGEVVDLLVNTEDTAAKMAERMSISRSLFQRYVAAVYEKTKTQTRAGLVRLYFEEAN